jgi:hypothetical protein
LTKNPLLADPHFWSNMRKLKKKKRKKKTLLKTLGPTLISYEK